MSEHEWFHDHLTLYSAGGLTADECGRLERHAAECAACAQELAQWRLFDQGLDRLCAPVQFAADWEKRVLTRWQVTQKPPRRWSSPARWAGAAAAIVFIAVLGGAVNTVAQMGFVSFPGGESVRGQANLPPILPVFSMESESEAARTESRNELKQIGLASHSVHGRLDDIAALNVADIQNSNSIDYFPPSLALIVRDNSRIHSSISGGAIGGKDMVAEKNAGIAYELPQGHQAVGVRVNPESIAGGFASLPHSRVNVVSTVRRGDDSKSYSKMLLENVPVLAADSAVKMSENGQAMPANVVTLGLKPEDVLKLELAKQMGTISLSLRKYNDSSKSEVSKLTVEGLNASSETGGLQQGLSASPPFPNKGTVMLRGITKRLDDLQKIQDGANKKVTMADLHRDVWGHLPEKPPAKVGQIFLAGEKDEKNKDDHKAGDDKAEDSGKKHSATALKSTIEYYSLSGKSAESVRVLTLQPLTATVPEPKLEQPKGEGPAVNVPGAAKPQETVGILGNQQAAAQPKPDPQIAQRKIIRTGELEFEVDLFDNTVAQITKLIGAIPGAFVMTVNSDKLPNGKMKGSIVVRIPPEHLDKFVLDLRKDLAKTGELKTQRIGSQDVTKQYTDIESRLRAARTMEERFLAIIKTPKGEIKDLIAAERELGVWRTKIEEMEGEIRYYNNQVGLSTLTITAYEKEIRAAAAMVVTEQVTMKIEADDVEKSLQAALTAVTEAKGRVTKSDLKQHAAGQLEAVLQFEVAPAAAGPMKDKLKQLGIVTHQDSQRLQQAEGGAAPMGEPIKSRTNDVQFNVTLYNVANIKPRQEFNLQIAVADVAAEYQRLLELVLQTSGQVRVSQLDEKDKTNIFAQLDFDVPSTKRELFDKQLAALGDIVTRNTTRAGPGETATDRKVGYRLTLKSVTSIPPRETFVLQAYSLEVPVAFKTLHEAVRAKGPVRVIQLDEQNKQNITAQLDFDVPAAEQAAVEKLLDELGEVHSRTTNRVPPSEIATEKKVGYRLTLRSQIPPRETVALGLEVSEVERVAADLANLVRAAKGKVTASQITQDAAGRAAAFQLFDVPLAAKDDLLKKFKLVGKVRAQKATQNLQAPDGKLATAHIDVTLTNLSPIVPADESLWGQIRTSLGYAFRLLSVSLMFVIVGICVILPWALLLWVAVKLVRRARAKGQATA